MKNYYDELEVSKTASKEVIEKVYKTLAKKYHPDTTQEIDKKFAEEKFKIISEAYEILSDDEKRKKYDLELEQLNPVISYEQYRSVVEQRDLINNQFNILKNELYQNYNNNTNQNINQKKYKYHNSSTGQPVSAFAYYIYKIKEFFFNAGLLILSMLAAILIINAFSDFNLFSFFKFFI